MMFLFNLKTQTDTVWKGQVLDPRGIIFLPPQAEHHKINPPSSWCAAVSFDRDHLENALASLNGPGPALSLQTSRVLLPEAGPSMRSAVVSSRPCRHRSGPSFLSVPRPGAVWRNRSSRPWRCPWHRFPGETGRLRRRHHFTGGAAAGGLSFDDPGESLYLADLCAVAGVGERTLRYIFHERYGISPIRYLKLRRLHQIRRVLRRADPDLNTVKNVANRCGVWHLGRFAQEYKAFFSETPSETLSKTCLIGKPDRLPALAEHRRGAPSLPGVG